ncbi:MAG: hypothetical protein U0237_08675 [Thermoleophilia bacterium]
MTGDPRPPFEMLGAEDAPVCVDGVCEVPAPPEAEAAEGPEEG